MRVEMLLVFGLKVASSANFSISDSRNCFKWLESVTETSTSFGNRNLPTSKLWKWLDRFRWSSSFCQSWRSPALRNKRKTVSKPSSAFPLHSRKTTSSKETENRLNRKPKRKRKNLLQKAKKKPPRLSRLRRGTRVPKTKIWRQIQILKQKNFRAICEAPNWKNVFLLIECLGQIPIIFWNPKSLCFVSNK